MLLSHDGFRRLCDARARLQQLDDSPITIAELARELRISPFHFIRQFECVFGVTPHQYRIQARLDRARRLLAAGRMSVTEVCMQIGFSSLGTFSDLFSRRVGETPSGYQRRLRAAPARFPGCFGLKGGLPADAFRAQRNFREASTD